MDNLEFEMLTAAELHEYIDSQNESDYLLIDVRQPEEYEENHIPGASLIPLPQLEADLYSLPGDKDLIFYCNNEGRSQWAASLAGESDISSKKIYHLVGGMLAWQGKTIQGYPRVKVFDKHQNLSELLLTAMNLEKGAWRYYRYMLVSFAGKPIFPVIATLAKAEKAHAHRLYRFLEANAETPASFEDLYRELDGEILEGGLPLVEMVREVVGELEGHCLNFVQTSLSIEYAAFDLYRTMAQQAKSPQPRAIFLSLAQAEKAHMKILSKSIEMCAEE